MKGLWEGVVWEGVGVLGSLECWLTSIEKGGIANLLYNIKGRISIFHKHEVLRQAVPAEVTARTIVISTPQTCSYPA